MTLSKTNQKLKYNKGWLQDLESIQHTGYSEVIVLQMGRQNTVLCSCASNFIFVKARGSKAS